MTTSRRKRSGTCVENSCAVTRVGLRTGGTSVLEVAQRAKTHRHDRAADDTAQVRHERDAARVVFESWVVEALRRGKACVRLIEHRFSSTESDYG